jgi:hypothetical protein
VRLILHVLTQKTLVTGAPSRGRQVSKGKHYADRAHPYRESGATSGYGSSSSRSSTRSLSVDSVDTSASDASPSGSYNRRDRSSSQTSLQTPGELAERARQRADAMEGARKFEDIQPGLTQFDSEDAASVEERNISSRILNQLYTKIRRKIPDREYIGFKKETVTFEIKSSCKPICFSAIPDLLKFSACSPRLASRGW